MAMFRRVESERVMDLTYGQIADLKIPDHAILEYEGCGSHEARFVWEEPLPPEEEQAERVRRAEAERVRQEAEREDREAGF